jgi:hypothetical protein
MTNGKRRWFLRGGVVGMALVVGLITWLGTRGGEEEPAAPAELGSAVAGGRELGNIATMLGQPVYWAGPMPDTGLVLSEAPSGGVQVRYQPAGTEAGEGSSDVLTIGSYPLSDPAAALHAFAARPGSVVRRGHSGVEVVWSRRSPTSAYFVPVGNKVLVEVYDPSPERAHALALTGRVRPAP